MVLKKPTLDNDVINVYTLKDMDEFKTEHYNPSFKFSQISHPSRIAVVAPSGTGKTNWLLNFIGKMYDTFEHVYVVHQIDEGLYDLLRKKLGSNITFFKGLKDVPQPKDLLKEGCGQVLFVFDDVVTTKNQEVIENYYIYGRKIGSGITSCYLSQSYYDIPKPIRKNMNYCIILKFSTEKDTKLILSQYTFGLTKDELFKIYEYCTKDDFNFLKIDISNKDRNKKFSHNWIGFVEIE